MKTYQITVAHPLLFSLVSKHLETEASCWTFGKGMLPHSCMIEDSNSSTLLGHLCHIFHFTMHKNRSIGETSGLRGGQFVPWLFHYKSMLL